MTDLQAENERLKQLLVEADSLLSLARWRGNEGRNSQVWCREVDDLIARIRKRD